MLSSVDDSQGDSEVVLVGRSGQLRPSLVKANMRSSVTKAFPIYCNKVEMLVVQCLYEIRAFNCHVMEVTGSFSSADTQKEEKRREAEVGRRWQE